MRNLVKRNGVWTVRVGIPADVRAAYGKNIEWISLRTTDDLVAIGMAAPLIAATKQRIAELRASGGAPANQVTPTLVEETRLNPDDAHRAIQRWRETTINSAYIAHFNGEAPSLSGDEQSARSDMLYELSRPNGWEQVPGFQAKLASALDVAASHPALRQRNLLHWFREAWLDVERHTDRFASGDFSDWSTTGGAPKPAPSEPTMAPALPAAASTLNLSGLLDRFVTSQKPKEESDLRYAWRWLVEFFGDVPASTITPVMADEFVVAIRRFPKTQLPAIIEQDIRTILADHTPPGYRSIAPRTSWKWATLINRVFRYAHDLEIVGPRNPFAAAMPKKPTKEDRVKPRRAYEPQEIANLFTRPLFAGFSGKADPGYRAQSGDQVVRDAKFWLPIFALWHGCRLEEIGGAELADFHAEGEGFYFDWTKRKLKTPEASRKLPVHPKLVELGFADYVAARRTAGDTYIFPELPHDPADEEAGTRNYSKWWGHWSDANGFPDPALDFHSFRHTFKEACRGSIDEELHDLLTGHKGTGGTGRSYGGVSVKVLSEALAKVDFPKFPKIAAPSSPRSNV